jgi:hypothetical protein
MLCHFFNIIVFIDPPPATGCLPLVKIAKFDVSSQKPAAGCQWPV